MDEGVEALGFGQLAGGAFVSSHFFHLDLVLGALFEVHEVLVLRLLDDLLLDLEGCVKFGLNVVCDLRLPVRELDCQLVEFFIFLCFQEFSSLGDTLFELGRADLLLVLQDDFTYA